MAKPYDRKSFKDYCLRKLGAPVIQINVSDEQIDDRIDEAFNFFTDFHFNGAEQIYLKHQITQEDIDNQYIVTPERLIGVTRIFDLSSSISTGSGMFNVTYQFVLNNLQDLTGYTIQNYYMTMQHLRFIQENLVGWPMIRYNRHVNKVYLDMDVSKLAVGMYIIIEAYDIIDPDVYADVWNDRWLQNYATVLIKEQWGQNLSKYSGVQLVGGMQFNGREMLADAISEREAMEEDAIKNLQPLIYNFSG
jgi:hypothetical protein